MRDGAGDDVLLCRTLDRIQSRLMLPADPDKNIVWKCFVIARHKDGLGLSDIIAEAKRQRMPMTRDDVLQILRRYVDMFDKDVRFTREKSS